MKKLLKTLSLVSFVFAAQQGFAQQNSVTLPKDAVSINPIGADVLSINTTCPAGVQCITNGTEINLAFHLGGCLDSLGPVTHDVIQANDGSLDVFISATRIFNKGSMVVRCIRENVVYHTISIPVLTGDEASVRVHFLGTAHTH